MKQRQEKPYQKFNSTETSVPSKNDVEGYDYAKMRVGLKNLDDALIKLGTIQKVNPNYGNKEYILNAIKQHNYDVLRNVSEYFFESSGIYQRLCKYLAYLYRYDWYIIPFSINEKVNATKYLNDFSKVLNYFESSDLKRLFGNIALEVIKNGSYYGYIVEYDDKFTIQQLPAKYCRSRFYSGTSPVVELNMRYFDDCFTNVQYRMKVLSVFPKEIQKGYILFKEGKLTDSSGDNGWYLLDPKLTVKFSLNNSDFPPLVGAIPSIIDLDQAQDLDRKKTMQQLLKIVIQKLPLDKNGELIFDIDEGREIHNNAVAMLKRAVGVDVLTTFADIDVANMQDRNSTTTTDDLAKVERTVYNNTGTSQNLFNTEGNLSLEKSIANDEAEMRDLLLQFTNLLNRVVKKFNRNSYMFKADILETTIYNYKELAKMYKEQTQIGYSRMLPQIALGHLQSNIIAAAQFENNVLKLNDIMIPPLMSSTMSNKTSSNNNTSENSGQAGRPEKADDQKSEKTIQNKESMS